MLVYKELIESSGGKDVNTVLGAEEVIAKRTKDVDSCNSWKG